MGQVEHLTRRQREVASLVAQGLTNRDIAVRLVVSERTAEGHIEQIRLKLGVRTRTQIAAWVLADRAAATEVTRSPEIHYARNGAVDIAYQVLGAGPPDLLAFSSSVLPIDSMNDEPLLARFHHRLASFARLIRFDLRGVGMSDPVIPSNPPTLEQWAEDAVAVLDAIGSEQAAVFAPRDTSLHAIWLAATYPDRVSALVLVNGTARAIRADDYPIGIPQESVDRFLKLHMEPDAVDRGLDYLAMVAPSVAGDTAFRAWWNRAGNRGASPSTSQAIQSVYLQADVRPLLPLVRIPALVLHRRDSLGGFRVGHGRYLAEHLANASYLELEGADDLYWVGDTRSMLDAIERFLAGVHHRPRSARAVMTVLSAGVVGSRAQIAQLGDRRWREVLGRNDVAVRREVERFRGRPIKSSGDAVVAAFDGPVRAVKCACAVRDAAAQLGLEVRAGIHSGEVEVRGAAIGGMAVDIATQVAARAEPRQVLVSRTVVDLIVGSGIKTTDRGDYALDGAPGHWRLFAVQT